jgi:hypothetical protein
MGIFRKTLKRRRAYSCPPYQALQLVTPMRRYRDIGHWFRLMSYAHEQACWT